MSNEGARVRELMQEYEPVIIGDFKYLHQHPELSFKEFNTSDFIRKRLTELGIEIMDYGLETGVVGLLRGSTDGPCIGLRAEREAGGRSSREIDTRKKQEAYRYEENIYIG